MTTGYDFNAMPLDEFIKKAKKLPGQDEVIEGVLPANEVMLICGDPWQGKSLELQRLACAFGAGGVFHGLRLKKCRAFYIAWEGSTGGISNRFEKILKDFPNLEKPILKLVPEPMPLNRDEGYNRFLALLSDVKKRYSVSVSLIDSFPYTFQGNPRIDEDINKWWQALKRLANQLNMTFIIAWELTKIVFAGGAPQEAFHLQRLKTASTTAYKVHSVIAVGEEKKHITQGGKTVWASLGHRIVLLKAKDAIGSFQPLKVSLNRDTLCWNGQHWEFDPDTCEYLAVGEGLDKLP